MNKNIKNKNIKNKNLNNENINNTIRNNTIINNNNTFNFKNTMIQTKTTITNTETTKIIKTTNIKTKTTKTITINTKYAKLAFWKKYPCYFELMVLYTSKCDIKRRLNKRLKNLILFQEQHIHLKKKPYHYDFYTWLRQTIAPYKLQLKNQQTNLTTYSKKKFYNFIMPTKNIKKNH